MAARALAWATCAGMFIVLVMGAAVTNTGSAQGCGRSWPLCNGQFVPEFTVSTAIEYSHRAVTGVEGFLVLALTILLVTYRTREAWLLGGLMLGTLVLQAGLGAAAVLAPQSPYILATHFGVSLAAFSATYLAARLVMERTGAPASAAPTPSARAAVAICIYLLGVVYLGAYLRHAGISLACADWPLCNGQVVPVLEGPTLFVFGHRLAALAALVLLGGLAWRTPSRTTIAAAVLTLVQAVSGAFVVWTEVGLFSALAHAAVVALLFAAVASLVRESVLSGERNGFVAKRYAPSDGTARGLQAQSETSSYAHVLASTRPGLDDAAGRDAVVHDRSSQR
jgi:cytochrome c oxidase assembly protein subunit 15